MRHSGITQPGRTHLQGTQADRASFLRRATPSLLASISLGCLLIGSCRSTKGEQEETDETEPTESEQVDPQTGEEPAVDSEGLLRQDAEVLSLKEQRKRFLVDQYLENAKA